MPSFAALRLNWEPRILSVLRIILGLLYMEHGLAKILDFPHQPNHSPYALFTLVPGLQGLLELVGGLLLALGFVHTTSRLLPRRRHGSCLFYGTYPERLLPTAQWRGTGNRLLFRFSLLLPCGRWRMEPR